ncbi:hypothetical protein Y032_0100g3305 [Ancylostoma ceylanicum]|uniref:Uncharacterized protein n=1 Tax=Ancylostoma ceylanicum TaxID=53326 RepID=A0A016TIA4_9BILA|nr:hypothetical protein Y032_0100g3305 [Ancylostoma ceylanicum]
MLLPTHSTSCALAVSHNSGTGCGGSCMRIFPAMVLCDSPLACDPICYNKKHVLEVIALDLSTCLRSL